MSRPTPLEIQDALFAHPLRVLAYTAAALAVIACVAPWEAGPDGIVWTWDLWDGREAFFLVPLAGGLVLAVASGFEGVPGMVLSGASLVLGVVWLLVGADGFEPLWLLLGGDDAARSVAVAAAVPTLVGALSWRLALHRTLVGRIVLGLAAATLAALFLVSLGNDGRSVLQAAVLDRFAAGDVAAVAAALPAALVLLAATLALAGLPATARGTGGFSLVARAAFHMASVSAACAALFPALASLPDRDALSYGAFAAPLKMTALWWCALAWTGAGAGSLAAAVEAYVRRQPLPAARRDAGTLEALPPPAARPIVRGEPVLVPPAAPAAVAEARPLDLSPLPPPPGLGPADGVPVELHAKDPSEVVEIKAQHALPILDTTPTPKVPAPAPPPAATAAEPPRPGPRGGGRTVLGMPGASPGFRPGPGTTPVPRPDQSGRTGDTSLGLPAARPRPPSPSARPPEDSGLRFWPPRIEDQAVRPDAATPAFGVGVLRDLAIDGADPSRRTPATPGIPPLRATPAPAPSPEATPEVEETGAAAEAIRFRVSLLQRQLARGELTQEEYRRRIDELRKPRRP